MVRLNKCGHPMEWVIRLTGAGKRFHYCIGCIIEKLGVDNLESYPNPYIDFNRDPKKVESPKLNTKTVNITKKKKI